MLRATNAYMSLFRTSKSFFSDIKVDNSDYLSDVDNNEIITNMILRTWNQEIFEFLNNKKHPKLSFEKIHNMLFNQTNQIERIEKEEVKENLDLKMKKSVFLKTENKNYSQYLGLHCFKVVHSR